MHMSHKKNPHKCNQENNDNKFQYAGYKAKQPGNDFLFYAIARDAERDTHSQ